MGPSFSDPNMDLDPLKGARSLTARGDEEGVSCVSKQEGRPPLGRRPSVYPMDISAKPDATASWRPRRPARSEAVDRSPDPT